MGSRGDSGGGRDTSANNVPPNTTKEFKSYNKYKDTINEKPITL